MYKFIVILILLTSCHSNERKEKLAENFVDMRMIPSSILTVKWIENYEIGYQDESKISERYHYPDNYVIGVLDKSKNDYKYITYIENISPIDNYEYVKSILDAFESDSTQLRVLILEDDKKIRANVYRKVTNNSAYDLDWAMSEWVCTEMGELKFETEKSMNQYLFK
ncbi:MAG: hypothetical protein MK226_21840 [Saprospiraceae bacterium]|nr:hypothetical protein [Saprospiraceae bacterium]